MKNQFNSTNIKMKIQMESTRLPGLLAALFLSLTMLVTSCSKLVAASDASAPANEPVKAKPFEGQIFRTADDRQAITLVSRDELEMRGGDAGPDNLICKYTRQDDTLRVVKTMLGTTLAVYYKITPDGLQANDGTVLFNPAKFKTERLVHYSGVEKLNKRDYDGAIADFNSALELDPKYALAYNYRGDAKQNKGDLDGAIADYNRAIELDPKNGVTYLGRGYAKRTKGDHDGAIADYNRAIELDDPKNILAFVAYDGRGSAKSNKGDQDGAITDYNKAIELKPDYASAYHNRGQGLSL